MSRRVALDFVKKSASEMAPARTEPSIVVNAKSSCLLKIYPVLVVRLDYDTQLIRK